MIFSKNIYEVKMGLNVGFNAITTGGLFLVAILLVVTGILFVSAAEKVKDIPEFEQSSDLQNAYNKLKTAYILTFVGAGVALILSIVYAGHEIWWGPSEWIHTVFFLIIAALIIIADVYAYGVLNSIYTPELADRNGSDNFIWAGLWISLLGFLVLLMVGSGRAGYNTVRGRVQGHFDNFKKRIEETHMHITGQAVVDDGNSVVNVEYQNPPPPPQALVGPPPSFVGPNCPRSVVRKQGHPPPPSRSVRPLGPPVKTTYTTVTESKPLVETFQRTTSKTEMSPGNFF